MISRLHIKHRFIYEIIKIFNYRVFNIGRCIIIFFNVDAELMKGFKGFSSYLMLFFTVAGVESILNLIAKKIGFDCGDRK